MSGFSSRQQSSTTRLSLSLLCAMAAADTISLAALLVLLSTKYLSNDPQIMDRICKVAICNISLCQGRLQEGLKYAWMIEKFFLAIKPEKACRLKKQYPDADASCDATNLDTRDSTFIDKRVRKIRDFCPHILGAAIAVAFKHKIIFFLRRQCVHNYLQ